MKGLINVYRQTPYLNAVNKCTYRWKESNTETPIQQHK